MKHYTNKISLNLLTPPKVISEETQTNEEALIKQISISSDAFNDGSLQGNNDFGRIDYNGPCPPPGKPHRYFFKIYALDTTLKLKERRHQIPA